MKKNLLLMIILLSVAMIGCSVKPKDPNPSTGDLTPLELGNYWNYMTYNENSGEVEYARYEVRDTMTVLDSVHLYKLFIGEANSDFSSIIWSSSQYIEKGDSFLYHYSYNDSLQKDMPNQIKIGDSWISDWDEQEYIVEDKDTVDVPAGGFFAYKIKVYPYCENHSLSYYKWIAEDIGLVKEEHDTWTTILMGYLVK